VGRVHRSHSWLLAAGAAGRGSDAAAAAAS